MLSWTEPIDWDDRPEPEEEWPGELPEYIEEWNQLWWEHTISEKSYRWWKAYGGTFPVIRVSENELRAA